jgi:hypothetical protein
MTTAARGGGPLTPGTLSQVRARYASTASRSRTTYRREVAPMFARATSQVAGPRSARRMVMLRTPRRKPLASSFLPQTSSARARTPGLPTPSTRALKKTRRPGPSSVNGSVRLSPGPSVPERTITSGSPAGGGIGPQGVPDPGAGRFEPADSVPRFQMELRVVLREDLADAPFPAKRVVARDLAGGEELRDPPHSPPALRAVRLADTRDVVRAVDVVAVLVDEGVRSLCVSGGRNRDEATPARAAVTPRGRCATARCKLPVGNEPDRHAFDLVSVRRVPQQVRVPLDVDVRRLHVEPDRATFPVVDLDSLSQGGRSRSSRCHCQGEKDEEASHSLWPMVGARS